MTTTTTARPLPQLSPLALSNGQCAVCYGVGTRLSGKICPCVVRRAARIISRLDGVKGARLEDIVSPRGVKRALRARLQKWWECRALLRAAGAGAGTIQKQESMV